MKTIRFFKSALIIVLVSACFISKAQNTFPWPSSGNVGIGTTTPDSSAILDLDTTRLGFLMPRMTQVQRNAIVAPATGLIIYQKNNTPGFYYYTGSAWTALKQKAWLLTGNGGTDPATNFIGTTDAKDLVFRVNNSKSGLIEYNATLANTSFGFQALNVILTGKNNTATGYNSLYQTSSGSGNTAVGAYTMFANTSGYSNTAAGIHALHTNKTVNNLVAIGDSALYNNNSGIQNTAVGSKAGYAVTAAAYNSFFGFNSGKATTTGNYNTAVGSEALKANTTGASNSTVGEKSMISNTTGRENTAEGSGSLQNNVIGNDNVANGFWSLYNNTTGYSNVAIGVRAMYKSTDANNLVAVGDSALYNQASVNGGEFSPPANNTAVGSKSLYANTGGANNTATGFQAANLNSTGSANTAIGFLALFNNVTGANNTAIGALADVTSSSLNNATAIGNNAKVNASNKMQLGSSTTVLATSGGYTIVSDGRFKENIKKDDLPGLAFINKLNPVSYNFNYSRFNDFLNKNVTDKSKLKDAGYLKQLAEKSKLRESGFIAQEVDKICRDNKYVFTGVYTPQNDNDNYALDYSRFVVPLVKAVQELSVQNDELKNQNTALTAKVADLQKQINDLKSIFVAGNMANSTTNKQGEVILSSAFLEQNIPNPFNHTTTINYILSQTYSSAKIIITDKLGKTLKEINISGNGKGSIKLDASTLAAGTYNYSLYMDGKLINSKQMVLMK